MPVFENPQKRGNLYVTFTIDFPKTLSDKQKASVREILA